MLKGDDDSRTAYLRMRAGKAAIATSAFRDNCPEDLAETWYSPSGWRLAPGESLGRKLRWSASSATMIGESNQTLYYLLEWESLAEREAKWGAFLKDPEWLKAREETEKDGPIVAKVTNYILEPTPYSSVR